MDDESKVTLPTPKPDTMGEDLPLAPTIIFIVLMFVAWVTFCVLLFAGVLT